VPRLRRGSPSARTADAAALRTRLEKARAQGKGGEVSLVASLDGRREVELKLPGRYRLDGALRGALKSAPGVVLLEDA
jgi:DNA polymerase-3 subunit alpha